MIAGFVAFTGVSAFMITAVTSPIGFDGAAYAASNAVFRNKRRMFRFGGNGIFTGFGAYALSGLFRIFGVAFTIIITSERAAV